MGIVGVSGLLQPSLSHAKDDKNALNNQAVWREDVNYEDHRWAIPDWIYFC